MYKAILLPTDGSALSRQAVTSGIEFAKESGSRVVGLHVLPVPRDEQLEAWIAHDPHYPQRHQAVLDKFADEYLAFIATTAHAEGVQCDCKKIKASDAARAIAAAAGDNGCDLVFMASHGWSGADAATTGSETLKVLRYAKVPVLVHKPAPGAGRTGP
jgi:nucleotide-binding universal stress UspA family protein